ncbi:MAG: arylsulfatase family protein [Acidimicrobiales bacterium]|nr:arylsulfatase family protein [Acidimicrobiales bacterium]
MTGRTGGEAAAGPYAGFGGELGRTFAGSQGWWPPRPQPAADAPNVVIVLVDDLGFSDLSCYGSEIATPHLDALAADGLQWTNFHVTPMCSPTRAALLTGVNPHRAGAGAVANSDPGFPGYAAELADDVATAAEIFRSAGYATLAAGKWHLTKDADMSDAGPKASWPLQRGFDRYYGFLDAFTNLHQPHRLVEDNHTVRVDRYPDGYFLTDDLTDRSLDMVAQVKASNPSTPFLLYLAHGAVHAPLHAKPADLARHRGRYDGGWDRVREARHRRQLELGILPPGTQLPARNSEEGDDVPAWSDLDERDQRLFARYMEVYAAMVDNVDQNVGRLRAGLAELGVLDDTIFVFLSDNGASREGESEGTSAYLRTLVSTNAHDLEDPDADLARIDLLGGPQTMVHYPRGWAMASNTPFRLYKVNTHAGGHSVPFLVSWPRGLPAGERRGQWAYVTDVLPTLLELTGVERPAERAGVTLQPLTGSSLRGALADPDAPHPHTEQYFEMIGHRGYYRDGWEAVTRHRPLTAFGDHEWELYHLADDPTEVRDLAAEEPDRVRDLAAAWEAAALENQVFPLDEGSRLRYVTRPPYEEPLKEPVRLLRRTHTLERYRSQLLIQWRSFRVDVELDFHTGDRGMLVAHGDQGGGYALYVDEGDDLVFVHNGYGTMRELRGGPVPDGTDRIVLDVTAPGQWQWDVRLTVGDESRGSLAGLAMLGAMAPFCGIDVGIDRRSPVSWAIYERHGPFPFTGELIAVTYTPGETAPDAGDRFVEMLREIGARYE